MQFYWPGGLAVKPALLLLGLAFLLPGAARAAAPRIPTGLTMEADLIDEHEMFLRRSAGVTPGSANDTPYAVDHFVLSHLDESRDPGAFSRKMRLGLTDDDGIWCFAAEGLSRLAVTLTRAATTLRQSHSAEVLGGLAIHLDGQVRDRCGGPGGRQARREWDKIGAAWSNNPMGNLHRHATDCVPVPMPGMTACAPQREEVLRLSPGEALLLGGVFAAGLATPAILAAFGVEGSGGLTWAALAGTVVAP